MASVKIVLRKKKNKDNTYPIALRITKDRKTSFIHLGYSVKESEWDAKEQKVKKSHPNSARLNNFLIKKRAEASDKAIELESDKSHVSSRAVKHKLKSVGGGKFFEQATLYLETLKKLGKHNQYSANKPRINRFSEFLKDRDITFSEITVPLLERFKIHLKTTRTRNHTKTDTIKPISDRTVINHLATIRSVFGFAIKSGATEKHHSPFGSDKIVIKFPETNKIGLTAQEVNKLETLDLQTGSTMDYARDLWLFSFYFAGIRVSDVLRLKWSDFQNGRLYYTMGKNDKTGSLKIPEKAQAILDKYKGLKNKHKLVFPDLGLLPDLENTFEVQRKIASVIRKVDVSLHKVAAAAKIDKPLTMHIARHTFGNLSGDAIPIQMLQKLYRHSSVTTTIGYQSNFMHKDADDALEAVISGTTKQAK